jgi:Domain of unknown function (DUF1707)
VDETGTDPRRLRVSDAEREHVAELLQRAVGRGLIDLAEFGERTDAALASRTRGELNAVLADLPGLAHPERPGPAPAVTRVAGPQPPAVTEDAGSRIRAVLGSVTRRGEWDVPARLVVETTMGSVKLDLSEATVPHERVDIELDVLAGSVELRLPAGARVDTGGLHLTLSSADIRRRARVSGDGPLIVLTGSVRVGSVDIRGPRRALFS